MSKNTHEPRTRVLQLAVLSAAAIALGSYTAKPARAGLIPYVEWTFESSISTSATSSTSVTSLAPEVNPGSVTASATAIHAVAGSYNGAAGNGSSKALSVNKWSVGDYTEFDFDPTTYPSMSQLTFDAVGSGTGPGSFEVETSTGGVFSNLASYNVISSPSWSTVTASTSAAESYSFDLSAIAGLTAIRLVDLSTVSSTGGVVGTAGTSRIDNVTVFVPEPASAGILAAGAAFLLGRRRRR